MADTQAPALTEEQVPWWNLWGKLKAAAADLDAAVARLEQQRDFAMSRPALADEFSKKLADIESTRGKVVWLRDHIRSVLSSVGITLSGMEGGGLGFVWVPVAVVAAGVAYVAKLAAEAWELSKRIDEQRRLEGQGIPPAQAAQIVAQATAPQSSLVSGVKWAALLAVIVGGFWLARKRGWL